MTAKLKQIIERLNTLVSFSVGNSTSDEDLIADIDAANLLCNTYDDLGIDRTAIRKKMDALYPQLSLRIYGKENIQLAMPLIKAFYRYIYGRGVDDADRGPANRRHSFEEMCRKVVEAYRKNPLVNSSDYLFALNTVCRSGINDENRDIKEYKQVIASYLVDIDNVSAGERIRRVNAYNRSLQLIEPDNREKWAEIRELIMQEDISSLDDDTFLIWREITDLTPLKELKKRAGNSRRMEVEYLQALIFTEFEREQRLAVKRKLNRDLKTLDDDLIGDIISIKIDADMSVSTLYALEIIFYLRLQLAQASGEENELIYGRLRRNRFEQLSKALMKKYKRAKSLNEKIEILERLEVISLTINGDHDDFALNEADNLLTHTTDLSLTYAQQLRLEWLPGIQSQNDSEIVAELMKSFIKTDSTSLTSDSSSLTSDSSSLTSDSSFTMATIDLIIDNITDKEREAVIDRYELLVNAAIASKDATELSRLLPISAYWNSDPAMRQRLTGIVTKAATIKGIPLPERRVNIIAAQIYAEMEAITRDCIKLANIPA